MLKVKDELERRTKSDRAWEKVIEKLPVLDIIDEIGYFEIDSKQLKRITGEEPRLIAKFDAEDKLVIKVTEGEDVYEATLTLTSVTLETAAGGNE